MTAFRRRLFLFSPVVVAFFVMLPRLLSPQFGLLDDGQTLHVADVISHDWTRAFTFFQSAGRFFPSYFLFFYLVHSLVGADPLLFFAVNCAVFAAIAGGLVGLVRLMGGTPIQAWAAGLVFVVSGPAVENFYTLSKAEPPQLLWVVTSLLLAAVGIRSRKCWIRAVMLAATTGALLVADTTKETGIVTVAIAVGWFLVGRLCLDPARDGAHLAWRNRYLVASLLAAAGSVALRAYIGMPSLAEGEYSRLYRLEVAAVLQSLVDALTLAARDLPYLAPLVVLAIVLRMTRPHPCQPMLLDAMVWMTGWLAVYLPWSWILEYYLLPFAFGAAGFCGVVAGEALQTFRDDRRRGVQAAIAICLGAFLVLFACGIANTATSGAIQLAVDAANHQLVRFIGGLPQGSVVSVNIPMPNEYVYEIGLHVKGIEGRSDIIVDSLATGPGANDGNVSNGYVATLVMKSQVVPGPRIAMDEGGAAELGRTLVRALGDGREPVLRIRRRVQLVMFNLHQPLCKVLDPKAERLYCRWPAPFVDTRVFSYGWNAYRR